MAQTPCFFYPEPAPGLPGPAVGSKGRPKIRGRIYHFILPPVCLDQATSGRGSLIAGSARQRWSLGWLQSGSGGTPTPVTNNQEGPYYYTYLDSEQETKIYIYIYMFFCFYLFMFLCLFFVFGRFSGKVGPRNVPNGPALKNAT